MEKLEVKYKWCPVLFNSNSGLCIPVGRGVVNSSSTLCLLLSVRGKDWESELSSDVRWDSKGLESAPQPSVCCSPIYSFNNHLLVPFLCQPLPWRTRMYWCAEGGMASPGRAVI